MEGSETTKWGLLSQVSKCFKWINVTFFTHAPCGSMGQQMDFLPTPASVAAWVFRWQVSPPLLLPPLPHLQICQRPLTKTWFQRPLTIETENAMSGGWRVGLSLSMRSCSSRHRGHLPLVGLYVFNCFIICQVALNSMSLSFRLPVLLGPV